MPGGRACLVVGVLLALAVAGCEQRPAKRTAPSGPSASTRFYFGEGDSRKYNDDGGAAFRQAAAVCQGAKATPPPVSDAGPTKAAWLKTCDSVDLYYGMGVPADPVKARQCAYHELAEADRSGDSEGMPGAGVLMMIYANGEGVARNLDYATYMACRIPAAMMESVLRTEHLQKLRKAPEPKRFDYCDDATSGFAIGECSARNSRAAGFERNARLRVLTTDWTAPDKAALAKLVKAQEAFVNARVNNEIDLSGTLRTMYMYAAEDHVRDFTADLLKTLASGQAPAATREEAAQADAALNAMYRRARAPNPDFDPPRDIRPAQRAWLAYRDAWLDLAQLKWPGSVDSVLRALTAERTRQMGCDLGEGVQDGEADC